MPPASILPKGTAELSEVCQTPLSRVTTRDADAKTEGVTKEIARVVVAGSVTDAPPPSISSCTTRSTTSGTTSRAGTFPRAVPGAFPNPRRRRRRRKQRQPRALARAAPLSSPRRTRNQRAPTWTPPTRRRRLTRWRPGDARDAHQGEAQVAGRLRRRTPRGASRLCSARSPGSGARRMSRRRGEGEGEGEGGCRRRRRRRRRARVGFRPATTVPASGT